MKELTIKNFRGVNLREGLWQEGFSGYALASDIYGLGDDINKISIPGVLQKSMGLSAMKQASSPNNITNLIANFSYFNFDGAVYGIDVSAQGNIYAYVTSANNWKMVRTTSGQGSNVLTYGNTLLYATNSNLGSYDGTTWTSNFQSFSRTVTSRPMKIFAGSFFVGNGRGLDKYDGTTYSVDKLLLPADFIIRSIEVYKEYLHISADNGQYSRIFVWDGNSPTYLDQISLFQEKYAPTLIVAQGLLWLIGNRGITSTRLTPMTPIYVVEYNVPQFLFSLPINRDTTFVPMTGVATYQNGILIGSSENANASYEDGVGGVWFVGKNQDSGNFDAVLLWYANGLPIGQQISGIFSSGGNSSSNAPAVFISLNNTSGGTDYEVYQITPTANLSTDQSGPNVWQSLPIDAGSTDKKSWVSLKANFDALVTGQSFTVQYRLDDTTSWTALKTFQPTDPSTDRFMFLPIGRTSRTITIRIKNGVAAGVNPGRTHSFTLYYEPMGN